jgi:hypothetical protein
MGKNLEFQKYNTPRKQICTRQILESSHSNCEETSEEIETS